MFPRCSLTVRTSMLKQPCHQLLGEPDGLVLVAHFQPVAAGLGREDEKLSSGIADVLFVGHRDLKVFLRTVFNSTAKTRRMCAGAGHSGRGVPPPILNPRTEAGRHSHFAAQLGPFECIRDGVACPSIAQRRRVEAQLGHLTACPPKLSQGGASLRKSR